jgi:uncharacterized repeat protein (TIGR03803 family)
VNLNRFRIRLWLVSVILSLAVDASEQWKEKVLYSFQGGSDGTYPAGGVVFDQAGSLYGATGWDGSTGIGTVFQLTKQGGVWKKNLAGGQTLRATDELDLGCPILARSLC